MINIDDLRYDIISSIKEQVKTYGTNENDTKYTNEVIETSLKYVKDNENEFYLLDSPVSTGFEKVKVDRENRKRRHELELKMRNKVFSDVPQITPSGFLGSVFGVWILQSIVGWIVKKILDRIFKNNG